MLCGGCLAAASLASTQKGQHHQQRSPRHATRASPDSAKWSPSVGAYEAVPLPPGLTTSLMALVGLLQTLVSDGKVLQNREKVETPALFVLLSCQQPGEKQSQAGDKWAPGSLELLSEPRYFRQVLLEEETLSRPVWGGGSWGAAFLFRLLVAAQMIC